MVHYSVELHIASVLQRLIKLGLPQYCLVSVVRDGFPFIRLHGYRVLFHGHSTLTKVRNRISDYRIFVCSDYPFRDNQNPQPDLLNYSLR